MKPDPTKHNPDPTYLRELIRRAGHTQRSAAKAVGISDRAIRHYFKGTRTCPYSVQYALENLPKGPKRE